MTPLKPDRRTLLSQAMLWPLLRHLPLPSPLALPKAFPGPRVVLIILGRSHPRKTVADSELASVLRKHGAESEGFRQGPGGLSGLARELLTGVPADELRRVADNAPTLAEYVRKGRTLPTMGSWFITDGSATARPLRTSSDPDHGEPFAPTILGASGLAAIARVLGNNSVARISEEELALRSLTGAAEQNETLAFKTRAALEGRLLNIAKTIGAAPTPAQRGYAAIEAARCVSQLVEPAFLGLLLDDVTLAGDPLRSLVDYVTELSTETARKETGLFVVLPVDAEGTGARRERTEGQGTLFVTGPGIEPGLKPKSAVNSIDVCPTIGRLLKVKTSSSTGRAVRALVK